MKIIKNTGFILFAFLTYGQYVYGQITIKPLPSGNNASRIHMEEIDSTRLQLPFWDDFSAFTDIHDDTLWFSGMGTANISATVGVNPPSINVAVFDGWNNIGLPYSTNKLSNGIADSLVSRFIDLSTVNTTDRNTVYLSFFWQKRGEAEKPDKPDYISLQFRNADKEWVNVWDMYDVKDTIDHNRFYQSMVQVPNDDAYFHEFFQIRFQSYGRLSGGYDTWNIDYILLDKGRSDPGYTISHDDRAITGFPTSWLTKYQSMPYDHFLANLESNLQPITIDVFNLEYNPPPSVDTLQPVKYYFQLRDTADFFYFYDTLNNSFNTNAYTQKIEHIEFGPIDADIFDRDADSISLQLETKVFINAADTSKYLTYRVNDTVSTHVTFDKALAYDDGTAEWAAGMSLSGAKLAYRYVIPEPDVITEVQAYIPEFTPSAVGSTFNIVIWDNLDEGVEGRLLTDQHIVRQSTRLDDIISYKLSRSVTVSDTFYIGYVQSTDEFFPVGLDKSRDSHDEIFVNTEGNVWEQGMKTSGSLMLRPVFGSGKAVGIQEDLFRDNKIYPNPTTGKVTIEGRFDYGVLYDIFGREVLRTGSGQTETEVIIDHANSGLYILKLYKQGKYQSFKILVQ